MIFGGSTLELDAVIEGWTRVPDDTIIAQFKLLTPSPP
jgi:hypothetical protein